MNVLKSLARELIDRRLWPVAALLVVAMVAVPVLLLKPAAQPRAEPTATVPAPGGAPANVVSVAPSAKLEDGDRRLVGKPKDLFAMPGPGNAAAPGTGAPTGTVAPGAVTGDAGAATAPAPAGGTGGGAPTTSTGSPSGSPSVSPAGPTSTSVIGPSAPAARAARPRAYYVVDLRFGPAGRTPRRRDVPRLAPLPSSGRPAVLFFGVFNGGSSAGFLVSQAASVLATNCGERVRDCGIMRLRAGRRALIDMPRAAGGVRRYELKVLRIRRVLTRDTVELTRARSRVSRAGLCMISADANAFGSIFYEPSSGSYRATAPERGACKDVSAARIRDASAFGAARTLDAR